VGINKDADLGANRDSAFFDELVRNDRKLELDYEYACSDETDAAKTVRAVAGSYLAGYVAANNISKDCVLAAYEAMVRRYSNDIRTFIKTGKYPFEIDGAVEMPSRCNYDLFLILTILLTKHRCALMEELAKYPAAGRALAIGVGSGIELIFIGSQGGGDAYDLYINSFARAALPKWIFREQFYQPTGHQYDSVYAIELLEHLDKPYDFLDDCFRSLSTGGRLVVTTATNVPQFDHRFNFHSDEDFEVRTASLGFELDYKRIIPHAYPRTDIGARNAFYVFRKTS
jgi:hypothetical protein